MCMTPKYGTFAQVKRNMQEFERNYGIHFTFAHTGKMQDMLSLSTSVLLNKRCKTRAKVAGSICAHCYAERMAGAYGNLRKNLADNTRVLNAWVIPVHAWPDLLGLPFFRLEAFGDLGSATQVKNYINFATRNPETNFALWSKNTDYIAQAVADGYEIPENLIIIQSSCLVNKEDAPRYSFVEKVFTVYAPNFIETNDININCGARHCASCARCYHHTASLEHVNEKLK